MYVSMDKSEIEISCISKEKRNEKVEIPSFHVMIKEIWDIFADIKNLRKNFILDEYEKLNSNLRNNIRRIRKLYTLQKSSKIINKKDNNKNQIQNSSNQQQSS
jgi:SpoVK/Ycf46/Vps4 family AAA+-type ATPase